MASAAAGDVGGRTGPLDKRLLSRPGRRPRDGLTSTGEAPKSGAAAATGSSASVGIAGARGAFRVREGGGGVSECVFSSSASRRRDAETRRRSGGECLVTGSSEVVTKERGVPSGRERWFSGEIKRAGAVRCCEDENDRVAASVRPPHPPPPPRRPPPSLVITQRPLLAPRARVRPEVFRNNIPISAAPAMRDAALIQNARL